MFLSPPRLRLFHLWALPLLLKVTGLHARKVIARWLIDWCWLVSFRIVCLMGNMDSMKTVRVGQFFSIKTPKVHPATSFRGKHVCRHLDACSLVIRQPDMWLTMSTCFHYGFLLLGWRPKEFCVVDPLLRHFALFLLYWIFQLTEKN